MIPPRANVNRENAASLTNHINQDEDDSDEWRMFNTLEKILL